AATGAVVLDHEDRANPLHANLAVALLGLVERLVGAIDEGEHAALRFDVGRDVAGAGTAGDRKGVLACDRELAVLRRLDLDLAAGVRPGARPVARLRRPL